MPGSLSDFTGVLYGEITWGITGSTEVIGVGGPRRNTVHPPLSSPKREESAVANVGKFLGGDEQKRLLSPPDIPAEG